MAEFINTAETELIRAVLASGYTRQRGAPLCDQNFTATLLNNLNFVRLNLLQPLSGMHSANLVHSAN